MKADDLIYLSSSDEDTIAFGKRLGSLLRPDDVLSLVGGLGSGKTWLTKGIAVGLGVDPDTVVTSPTFALVNAYEGVCPLYHIDVYRLGDLSEFFSAGLEDYLHGGGVAVMEWGDRWPEILPDYTLTVALGIIDDRRREITLKGTHPRALGIIEGLKTDTRG